MMDELMTEIKIFVYEGKLYAQKDKDNVNWYQLVLSDDGMGLKPIPPATALAEKLRNAQGYASYMRR